MTALISLQLQPVRGFIAAHVLYVYVLYLKPTKKNKRHIGRKVFHLGFEDNALMKICLLRVSVYEYDDHRSRCLYSRRLYRAHSFTSTSFYEHSHGHFIYYLFSFFFLFFSSFRSLPLTNRLCILLQIWLIFCYVFFFRISCSCLLCLCKHL